MSRNTIKRHLAYGSVAIDTFEEENLNTTSYDARLGPWYFREQPDRIGSGVFNIFDEHHVDRLWGNYELAVNAGEWMEENGRLKNISSEDYLIIIKPGETILAHTIEFIGGRDVQATPAHPTSWINATTEMRARSSIGRVGITVCKCAGWGDIGYVNRWTMEITNLMRGAVIPLPVGMRICQLIFYEVDRVETSYPTEAGKYQLEDDLKRIKESWDPTMMLPKLDQDRDIGTFYKHIPDDFLVEVQSR